MKALVIIPALILTPLSAIAESTDSVDLDTVEITGQQEPLTEISVDKLLKVPGSGNDPLAAIGALPGVTFASGRAEPAVRGSSPDDNQYLIDFMPVGYMFHSDNSSLLSDNIIEDFALETSAWSPQYANATGAVIEATSRSPYYDQSQLVIDASFLKAGFFYEQPVNENQSFYLAARQSLFQYYIENVLDDEDFQFTSLPEYYDYQGKYEIRLNDQERVYFQIIGSKDQAGIKFDDDADLVQQDPGLAGDINFEAFFNSQGVVWQKLYNNGFGHKIGFSHLEQKFAFNVGSDNDINVKLNDFTLKSHFYLPLNYQHEVEFGAEITETHLSYGGTLTAPPCDELQPDCRIVDGSETVSGSGKPVIYNYDAFILDAWAVTPDWTLTPGLALSYDDYTQQTFSEPRLQSRWQFADAWWFTQGIGKHHMIPANLGPYLVPFGNEDLKQQEADHYELGLEQQLSADLLWKIEIYYKDLRNIIVSKAAQDPYYSGLSDAEYAALPRYTNEADGHAFGAEFFINKNLSDRWYGWLSVAWSRTFRHNEITDTDFSYNYDQPVIVNLVGNYRISDKWEMGIKWRYQSGQLITPLESAEEDAETAGLYNPVYGDLNSERLPAYHRLDVRFDRKVTPDVDLYIELLNLYNRSNVVGYEYTGADYSGREEVTDLPFIPSFGIKARF